ncbi:MAG TPA: c-type cytochrome domain-containing protein [Anaeromyxobacter sp.]|nr:c-type cytochrome domain-containing protein [Anaeromyxobacter sp.]
MARTWIAPALALLPLAALSACGDGDGSQAPPPPPVTPAAEALRWPGPSYAQVQAIFDQSCTSCHAGATVNGGLSLASPGSWANLVGVATQASAGGTRVVPNDSAGSDLHQRITASDLSIMPQPPNAPLPAERVEAIRAWIDEGGARQDLSVSLSGMTPHLGQRVVLRLESDSGELRSRIVLDPLPTAGFQVFVPRVRPTGSHVLAIWADHDRDGAYDAPPTDHAWSVSVPASGAASFAHNTTFTDVGATAATEPGLPFTVDFTGMTPHVGQTLTVALYKVSAAPLDVEPVGLYRVGAVPAASFSITIPGVVQAFEDYWVDIHADHDRDGAYDAPPTDHAWRLLNQSSGDTGLTVTFAHDTTFTDVSRYPAF